MKVIRVLLTIIYPYLKNIVLQARKDIYNVYYILLHVNVYLPSKVYIQLYLYNSWK